PQGVHDTEGCPHAGDHIRDRHAVADTTAARLAGDADHAALRLHDEIQGRSVSIRSCLAKARYRAVDNAGVAHTRLVIGNAQLGGGADAIFLKDHIKPSHHAKKVFFARLFLEVDLNAFFVPVQTTKYAVSV